jgi:hypothetical protein
MSQSHVRLVPAPLVGLVLAVPAALVLLSSVALDSGSAAALVKAAAGDSTAHEFFHDARHMLGFPCH